MEKNNYLNSLPKDELTKLANKEKDSYYSTLKLTNRTTDSDRILSLWKQCDDHWAKYQAITKILSTK
jgi:hypothetical protein